MRKALVAVVMGSESDKVAMQETQRLLDFFDVPYTSHVISAHRDPEGLRKFATSVEKLGYHVIIAGAGMAAHLAGCFASQTLLPVIGVPLAGSHLNGLDALLSTVQMPSGIPVATVAIGKAGARNAALLAVEILALSDKKLRQKLRSYRGSLSKSGG